MICVPVVAVFGRSFEILADTPHAGTRVHDIPPNPVIDYVDSGGLECRHTGCHLISSGFWFHIDRLCDSGWIAYKVCGTRMEEI